MAQISRLVQVGGMALFFILGWLYEQETPLLEAPDEPSHFSVVKYLADEKQLPPPPEQVELIGAVPTIQPGVPIYYAPPLYYVVSAVLIQDLNTDEFASAVIPNPYWEKGWGPVANHQPANKNAYIHTADQRSPDVGWAVAFHRLRLFSLLLGGVTVIGAFCLARQLWPEEKEWQWLATALVAFNPTFLFLSNGITNDALLIPLSTWIFVGLGWWLQGGKQLWGVAVLLGLAVLTKQSAWFLLLPVLLAIHLKARREHWPWHKTGILLACVGLIVALVGGWWYVYNGVVYGDFLGLFSHVQLPEQSDGLSRLRFLAGQLTGGFQSYWAAFGWALLFLHPAWYVIFALFTAVGLLGWLQRKPQTTWSRDLALVLGSGILLNGLLLLYWMWQIAAPYGRLLFPVLAPISMVLTEGWRRWLAPFSPRPLALWQGSVILTLIGVAAYVPFGYLHPAFATPLLAELPDLTSAEADFARTWHLVGYHTEPGTLHPGETTHLTLYWQATAETDKNMSVFAQLAPQDPEQRVAEAGDLLGTPRYPTSVWRIGDIIAQTHMFEIPETAVSPALYWFNVGLTDEEGSHPTITVPGGVLPGATTSLGPIRIMPEADSLPAPLYSTQYDFDSVIRLQGYDLDKTADSLQFILHWQALATPTADWHIFVHLVNAAGETIWQYNGPPGNGDYPTDWWLPGDEMLDTYQLPLPAEDGWQIRLGLYNWQDGQRAPVTNAEQQLLPEGMVVLQP